MTDRIEQIDNQIVQINRRLETHERKKKELNNELKAIKYKLRSANTYGSKKELKDNYNNQIVKKTNEIGKVDADILLEHHTLRELQREKQGTITHLRQLAVMPARPRSRSRSPSRRHSPPKTRSRSRSPPKRRYVVPDVEESSYSGLMDQLDNDDDISGGKRRRKKTRRRRKTKKYFSLF
jgi:chromosome segregation ATPase